MSQLVEVVLGHRRRKVVLPRLYSELVQKVKDIYDDSLPVSFKFFYRDPDGDLISVSTQEDYDIAYIEARTGGFEFIIYPDLRGLKNSPRWIRPPSYSITERVHSDTFCNLYEALHRESPRVRPIDLPGRRLFEESKDLPVSKMPSRCSTYPRLPEELNFSIICEEETPGTADPIPDKWPSQQNDVVACLSCMGAKINKKGKICKKCNGTGQMNGALKRHIERIIQKEVVKAVQVELEKNKQKNTKDECSCKSCKQKCRKRETRGEQGCDGGMVNCGGCCIF